MPSIITHLAIAKQYTELHPNKISNLNDFNKGSIAPDFSSDFSRLLSRPEKDITHYYFKSENGRTNFALFKHDKKVNLTNDFWKGYYAHLLTDDLFYNLYFKQAFEQSVKDNANLYDDFTKLTSKIITDYNLKIDSTHANNAMRQILATDNGKCKYLDYEKVHDFIEEVSANLNFSI